MQLLVCFFAVYYFSACWYENLHFVVTFDPFVESFQKSNKDGEAVAVSYNKTGFKSSLRLQCRSKLQNFNVSARSHIFVVLSANQLQD